MAALMPTLSTFGWVSNPYEKLDFALAHFFESDRLQSTIYPNSVSSFQWILQNNSNNPAAAADQVRGVLNTYLQRYYDTAIVSVSVEPEDVKKPGTRTIMKLAVTVTQDGKEYDAHRLALLSDGKFLQFVNINNEESS